MLANRCWPAVTDMPAETQHMFSRNESGFEHPKSFNRRFKTKPNCFVKELMPERA
jgi:hypothetical protein